MLNVLNAMPPAIRCSACSGRAHALIRRVGTDEFGLHVCEDCGGVNRPVPILREMADRLVGLGRPMLPEADDATYFDLRVRDVPGGAPRRVHGWYSPSRVRVVQFG